MFRICLLFTIFANGALALSSGPFVLWGLESLQNIQQGALERLSDDALQSLYNEAAAVVVFVRNSSEQPLNKNAFPSFMNLLDRTSWTYLPQSELTSDPTDFNINAEDIQLVGSVSQQDVEITALFHDAVNTFGYGKVLGILANDGILTQSRRHRRDIENTGEKPASPAEGSTTTAAPPTTSNTEEPPSSGSTSSPTDEPMQENFVYIVPNKAMLYTTSPPVLSDNDSSIELRSHGIVTADERKNEWVRFIVSFKVNRTTNGEVQKITLRFRFPMSAGYWSLTSVEIEDATRKTELMVVGDKPEAPIGFSYKCSSSLVFRQGSLMLTLENIQVQPMLSDKNQFSDAYDCVGFTTAPILAGIFVVSIMTVALLLGLGCLADIKTPNKFESNRGKQLTFSIQE